MDDNRSLLDRLVDALGHWMDAVGLNGTRLRWRWRNRQRAGSAASLARSISFRAVTGRHKMCPACRSLVATGATTCPECGEPIAHVSGPGVGRLLQWVAPGASMTTAAVISTNLALYILMGAVGGFEAPRSGGLGALFSLLGFRQEVLARFGLGWGPWVVGGEVWRLFTPLFIHAGLLHVLFNCYVMLQIGKLMEEEYGAARTWVVYLVGGVAGGLASNFLRPALGFGHVPYVGASGAVFALVGLAIVYGWQRGGAYGTHLRRSMLRWTLYMLMFGFVVAGVDNFAHIGGLVGGGLLGLVVPAESDARHAHLWRMAAWVGVAVVVWAFVMAGLHGADALTRR